MALFQRTRPAFARLEPSHAAGCSGLHAGAFAHGWSELEFERLIAAGSGYGDVALEARSLSGFILSRVAADEAEVLTIVVAPRWRGRGVAGELLQRHLARLAATTARALFLEVNADNAPALALYRRAGFVEVGRRKGYYGGPSDALRADALVLRRAIT